MQVRKLQILPIEAIVRGYITGSAWNEYKKSGTVHGIKVPAGLQESQAFPDGPIYTPSTKAEQGEHDENIHPDQGMYMYSLETRGAFCLVLRIGGYFRYRELTFVLQLPLSWANTPRLLPRWLSSSTRPRTSMLSSEA